MSSDLRSLPKETVRLIGSSQVITSVYSVVKELLENSLDAEATTVDIKLEDYGFDKIEVRDNGLGIARGELPLVALRYHTSKISSFSDLDALSTYGFRGEALGSLCAVSSLSVTSKSVTEEVSHTVTFDHHGNLLTDQPSHLPQGTTVVASQLFSRLPVRRQYYKAMKKRKEELRRVEDLCMAYGAIRPAVRLTLRHNKELVWQKNPAADTRAALLAVLGRKVFSQLEYSTATDEEHQVTVEAYLPRADSDTTVTSRSSNDRGVLAVNGRPVHLKEVEKIVRQHYCSMKACEGRYPVFFLSLTLPAGGVDVNLDPNKDNVRLQQQKHVLETITNICSKLYGPMLSTLNNKKVEKDNSNDTFNDSVNTSTSSEWSSLSPTDKILGQNPRNRNTDGKSSESNTEIARASKLTSKFSCGVDKEKEPPDAVKGYNISFYKEGAPVTTETESADKTEERLDNIEKVDSAESVVKVANITARSQENTERIDFDILDADLSDLLRTQRDTPGQENLHPSFSEANLFSDSVDFTKITPNVNLDKENVDSAVNAETAVGVTVDLNRVSDKGCDSGRSTAAVGWSRGTVTTEAGDQVLQPVQLLVPGNTSAGTKRPPSPTHDLQLQAITPPAKKKTHSIQADQPRIYDMVSSAGSDDKFSSGFVAFSKQIRPKVVEDNADASFDEITNLVRARWSKLTDAERDEFQQAGAQRLQEMRKLVTGKRQLAHKLDRRIAPVKGLPSIKDQLLAGAPNKGAKSKPSMPIKSLRVPFSLSQLKQVYKSGLCQSQTQANPRLRLIGPLKYYNGWVCCHGNQLRLINPQRVEETLLHREMMDEHEICLTKLERPQPISESSVVGAQLYQTLLDLVPRNSQHTYSHIEDRRLTANGIQVQCHADAGGGQVLELVGLSAALPQYGLKDLHEILDLIKTTGATTLRQSRPLKVAYYLQGEAVRMIRQRPVHRSREDMLDVLQQLEDTLLPVDCVQCLHNKPFLHTVYDMDNIPVTQSGCSS